MLRVLICVPPILPSTPWEPGPAPGRPRLVHIWPSFSEANSSSEGGARPSEDGNEGGEKPEEDEDRQLLAEAQWELVTDCLLLVCLAHFQDIERVIAFHDVDPTVGVIVHFKEVVAFSNYRRIHLLLEGTSLETRQKCRKTKDYSIPPKLRRPFDIVTIGIRFVYMTLSFVSAEEPEQLRRKWKGFDLDRGFPFTLIRTTNKYCSTGDIKWQKKERKVIFTTFVGVEMS